MKANILTLYLLITCTLLVLCGCHDNSKKTTVLENISSQSKSFVQPPNTKKILCPSLSDLTKDPKTQKWSAPNGWQSYDTSFSTKLTRFYGAQWNGAAVGQIFCIFHDDNEQSFYVLLAYNTLAIEPETDKWEKNQGGLRNCYSNKQQDCPFFVKLKPKEKDFYKEVYDLRKDT